MHRQTQSSTTSTDELSDHYDQIGPRDGDIDLAFALAGNPDNANVLEIGCGNGRDARAIMGHTTHYTGIDIDQGMIDIAQDRLPDGQFERIDATKFEYQGPYDIVFAFASLRYMDLDQVTTVLKRVYDALRPGGVFYISSNFSQKYDHKDNLPEAVGNGRREIYYYNANVIQKHAPQGFKRAKEIQDTVRGEPWFEVALQKAT